MLPELLDELLDELPPELVEELLETLEEVLLLVAPDELLADVLAGLALVTVELAVDAVLEMVEVDALLVLEASLDPESALPPPQAASTQAIAATIRLLYISIPHLQDKRTSDGADGGAVSRAPSHNATCRGSGTIWSVGGANAHRRLHKYVGKSRQNNATSRNLNGARDAAIPLAARRERCGLSNRFQNL